MWIPGMPSIHVYSVIFLDIVSRTAINFSMCRICTDESPYVQHRTMNVKNAPFHNALQFHVFTLIGGCHLLRTYFRTTKNASLLRRGCELAQLWEAGSLLICFVVVVGAGKLICVYVLYGVYTKPFTNRYSLKTNNVYYLGSRWHSVWFRHTEVASSSWHL
jgi:hypothetical protein